ncbi:hypothetical protein [uncultured Sphingomonas sp.]|uniref:hypothetical protein n=1 Tax=uncultured Sphingomonas sp. TaxID=158754 RepID=UPI0035CBBE99
MRQLALAGLLAAMPAPAFAGPPFLTDDPEPTDLGHWEIYAPLIEGAGVGRDYEGSFGAELNYGGLRNVQLTLGLPGAFAHDASGGRIGVGDLAVSVKYRFFHDEGAGVQIAVFPGLTLPTASKGLGNGRATALLPIWAQKDIGPWSIFGGGGYAVNPGAGNRSFWTGGIAVTRDLSKRLQLGAEIDRQGPGAVGARASTSLGAGGIVKLGGPFRFLASGGPTFTDGQRSSGWHGFAALGINI